MNDSLPAPTRIYDNLLINGCGENDWGTHEQHEAKDSVKSKTPSELASSLMAAFDFGLPQ